jgi:hypothetical protein
VPYRPSAILGLAVLASLVPRAVGAQEQTFHPAVTAVASTLGLGVEFGLEARTVGVRAGYFLFSFDVDKTVEGIRYRGGPDLRNGRVALDVHPFANAFRLTAGAVLGKSRAEGTAVLAGPITIGNRTYQPEEVGEIRGEGFYERDLMPYLGLGFATRGRVGVTFDLGVVFSGKPTVRLTGQTPLTGAEKAEFDAQVQAEEQQIQAAIDDEPLLRYYPAVSLGLRIRF